SAVAAVLVEGSDDGVDRTLGDLRDADGSVPIVLFSSSLPSSAEALGDGVEYVQRKNGASVDVLVETLRTRLGLDGGSGDGSIDSDGVAGRDEATGVTLEWPQLESVVEAVNDCILTVDDESVVQFANPAVEEVFGYEPSELVGEPLTLLMSDDLADRHLDAVDRYVETGERRLDWSSIRLSARHRDGHEFPIEVSFAEFTADGRHYFTGIVRDRSERERREAELRRAATIVETVDDGIYALGPDDRFVSVNEAYLEMTGYSREELLGAPASTVTGEELVGDIDRVRSTLETDEEGVTTLRTDLPTKGGPTIPVEARISRFELDDGEFGRVGVVRDVSERERLEAELSDALERITDAFFGLDEEWRFTYVNERAERLLQQAEEELVGESVWEQFPEAADSTFREEYERAMAEQEAVSFEEYYPPLDTWFEVNAYPSRSGLSVYFRDITERVVAQRELEARLTQQEAIAELGRTALRTEDLDRLMERAARLVAEGLDNDYCKVLDLDPETDELLLRQGVGWREGIAGSATVAADDEGSQAGYTLGSEEPVVVEDLTTEERFDGPELLTSHDVRSGISTIIGPYEKPWGILGTHDTERKSFSEHDVAFVQSVANLLWTAVERDELESTLRHERDLNRLVIDTAPVGIVVLDEDGGATMVNERAADIAGVSRERLAEGGIGLTYLDDDGNELPEEELPFTRVQEHGESVYDAEIGVVRPDGERRWLSVNGSTLSAGGDGGPLSVFSVEDVTETRNRTERLASLNEGLGRLPDAESPADVSDTVVETATDALGLTRSYVALYDDEDGVLRTAAMSDGASSIVDSALLTDAGDSPVWTAFVRDELRVVDDVAAEFEGAAGIGSVVVVPLGTHGVFVAVDPEPDAFGETDVLLAEMLGSTARASFDRAARESDLRAHRDDLEEKNERLDRLNRVNRAIRDITQVLLQADSHESIESLVCERLVDIDPYTFAWVGHSDRPGDEVVAAASA
ncbi:PAS domain S-box protein, partial [Halobium palmae]